MGFDALFDFFARLVQMDLYRQAEFFGVGSNSAQVVVADRIGRVGREAEAQQRFALQFVAQREAFAEVILGIGP